jgi:DNA-binding LytR/AlgR family response regulator
MTAIPQSALLKRGLRCAREKRVTIAMSKLDDLSTNGRPPEPGGREDDLVPRQALAVSLSPGDWEVLRRVLDSLAEADFLPDTRRLIIRSSRRLIFLNAAEIHWIEASGNYVRFHLEHETYVARAGIGRVADRLNQAEFVRIHRSTIVNLSKVKELEPCENGEYLVILKDGKRLSCSRGYCHGLQQMIKRGCAF